MTSPERSPVLVAEGLTRVFGEGDAAVQALRGVDLTLYQGEFVVLLGASGSGKSTLLNILGGLDTPTAGRVRYLGDELSDADEAALTQYRRAHVGFVFQFYNLIPSLTARENVALVTEIARDPMDPDDALALVGLGPAKRPDVLLCDEPTGALDAATGRLVLAVLDRVNRELGTTTAVITHNAPIATMAHRVVTLADGAITSVTENATRASSDSLRW